jgi:hypothetical protein
MKFKVRLADKRKIECANAFPPAAEWVRLRVYDIRPAHSAVAIITPKTGNDALRFDGPETTALIPVDGYDLFAMPTFGNKCFTVEIVGYQIGTQTFTTRAGAVLPAALRLN